MWCYTTRIGVHVWGSFIKTWLSSPKLLSRATLRPLVSPTSCEGLSEGLLCRELYHKPKYTTQKAKGYLEAPSHGSWTASRLVNVVLWWHLGQKLPETKFLCTIKALQSLGPYMWCLRCCCEGYAWTNVQQDFSSDLLHYQNIDYGLENLYYIE